MAEIREDYYDRVIQIIKEINDEDAKKLAITILEAHLNRKKILICGNGGSAADAQHLAAELVVRFKNDRDPLPAIALTTDTSILTATGNDYSFDKVFSRQVQALMQPSDILIVLSTSGRSPNIKEAVKEAKARYGKVIALLGDPKEHLQFYRENCELVVHFPGYETDLVQTAHLVFYHRVCEIIDYLLGK